MKTNEEKAKDYDRLSYQYTQLNQEYKREKRENKKLKEPCKCGNKTFTHRHTNWIECTSCNKIKVLQD